MSAPVITSANPNSPISTRKVETPLQGVQTWKNKGNGFTVVDLEYVADPRKRSAEWLAATRAGMPSAEFNREYGKEWFVYDGKPVYQDYDEKFHMIDGVIYAASRTKLVSGWDAGPNDVNIAWCLGMVPPNASGITFIDEYVDDSGDAEEFCQIVSGRLQLEWLKLGGFSIHAADQSVFTQDNSAKKRAFVDEMRRHGMNPIPAEISFARRRTTVEKLLKEMPKGIPRLRIHSRCETLREAMRGGYAYEKLGKVTAGGQYKEVPMKNKYSHIANAMEYACSRLEAMATPVPYEGRPLPRMSMV